MASKSQPKVSQRSGEAFTGHPDLRAGFETLASATFHPRGTILFRQGEPSRGVYLLAQGRANLLLRADNGRRVTFRTVGPGYVLGMPGTILNRTYIFTAELIEDSQVAFIPAADVVEFLRQRGDLCFDVVQMLGAELMELPKVIHKRATRKKHTNA
jgi:CRP/FNR family transcriptional regulator, nitrogen oxide reductase regulator